MDIDQTRAWDTLRDHGFTYYQQATEQEREIMRDWVTSIMRERVVHVTFVKADGTERTMPCTLQPHLLPEITTPRDTQRKYNPHVCSVLDAERGVWRSFRWDRVKRIEFTLG